MIGALLLLTALSGTSAQKSGPVIVLVVRRTSLDAAQGQALATTTASLLAKEGVDVEAPAESLRRLSVLGVTDPTQCGGRKACVLELLKQLESPAAVALSMSQLGSERSVAFEVWRTKDGAQLAKDAVVLKPGDVLGASALSALTRVLVKAYPADAAAPVAPAGVTAAKPVGVEPAPVTAPVLTPEPKPVQPLVVVEPAPVPAASRSHVVGVTLLVLAVVSASVAAAFAGSALTARGELSGGTSAGISRFSGSEAQQLADASNRRGVASGIAGGVTVALGVGAAVTW